jgi:hypothetical protein
MNFIWIVIALLVVVVMYVKFKHTRTQLFYKTLAVIAFLFVCSMCYVWLKSGVNLSSYEGFLSLGRTYFSWLGSFFGNIGSITGHAVDLSWGVNSTAIPLP